MHLGDRLLEEAVGCNLHDLTLHSVHLKVVGDCYLALVTRRKLCGNTEIFSADGKGARGIVADFLNIWIDNAQQCGRPIPSEKVIIEAIALPCPY